MEIQREGEGREERGSGEGSLRWKSYVGWIPNLLKSSAFISFSLGAMVSAGKGRQGRDRGERERERRGWSVPLRVASDFSRLSWSC
jgi:hypothetical protein